MKTKRIGIIIKLIAYILLLITSLSLSYSYPLIAYGPDWSYYGTATYLILASYHWTIFPPVAFIFLIMSLLLRNTEVKPEYGEERHKGLIIFGMILFVIGFVTSFYQKPQPIGGHPFAYNPYLGWGIDLTVMGIIFLSLGFLFPRKNSQRTTSQLQQA
jgi:hypothetical protein